MSLNKHFSDIIYRLKLIVDRYTNTIISILIIPRISRFVLPVQCGKHFGRLHSQICHPVLQQRDIDTFRSCAVEFYPVHPLKVTNFSLDKFGIIRQLPIRQPISGQSIKHAIYIAKVIFHHWCACPRRKRSTGISHFATQHIPTLLHILILHRTQQFYLNNR